MAEITVEVKYTNREFPRVFRLTADDFNVLLSAVKATAGARWLSAERRWRISANALKSLQTSFATRRADIRADCGKVAAVVFVATGEYLTTSPHVTSAGFPADARDFYTRAEELAVEAQAAYNQSDESLAAWAEQATWE